VISDHTQEFDNLYIALT